MMGEMPEELKNGIIIPVYKKDEKQKVENYTEISLLSACYKLYTKILNEKFKAQTQQFLFECQNGVRYGGYCTDPLFSVKLLAGKPKEFNMGTHFAFTDHAKASETLKERQFSFKYYKAKIFYIYY
jgi:hypothetical protein